jgi:DNA helicase IV
VDNTQSESVSQIITRADKDQEEDYFDRVELELDYSISVTSARIELGEESVKEQKKYMRDSHGDMDDEEFLQNMQSVNNDLATITRACHSLEIYNHQKKNPYFGKIAFRYDDDDEELPVYVGMSGYSSDMDGQQIIYDWRAPVSSMYYSFEKGQASYKVANDIDEEEFTGEILEKKQFVISDGRFRDVVDTDSNINDVILLEALGSNSNTKMKSVVATIQKEQNEIIRDRSAYNLIVDGRAGSGKTVIAMHRLAWLLYNYESLNSDNVMILSPNSIFADYISEVLPELEENSVPSKEFDDLIQELLFVDEEYETKLEQAAEILRIAAGEGGFAEGVERSAGGSSEGNVDRAAGEGSSTEGVDRTIGDSSAGNVYRVVGDGGSAEGSSTEGVDRTTDVDALRMRNIKIKSSIEFFERFNAYIEAYVSKMTFRDFHFQKVEYTKGQIGEMFNGRFSNKPVYERFENIAYFIVDRVEDSQNKEFDDNKKNNMAKQIQKQMVNMFAERNLVKLYVDFLCELEAEYPGIENYKNDYGKICYEDILPILYLQVYFYGCNTYNNIKHLIIDEMQDYTIFQYAVLDRIFTCKKTILGDSLQVLFYDPRETVVDVLAKIFQSKRGARKTVIKTLHTSYRSTSEITQFCNDIKNFSAENQEINEDMDALTVERHGKKPETIEASDLDEAAEFIAEKLNYGEMDDFDNIAVLVDDEREAYEAYKLLSQETEVTLITSQSTVYAGGVVVLPKFLAKGMEFDAVYVLTDGSYRENVVACHAHYIACTRALHQLYVLEIK